MSENALSYNHKIEELIYLHSCKQRLSFFTIIGHFDERLLFGHLTFIYTLAAPYHFRHKAIKHYCPYVLCPNHVSSNATSHYQ